MRISRCDVKTADETDFEEWPVLLDRGIASEEFPTNVEWQLIRGGSWPAGPARISLDDSAGAAPPQYKYEVELSPEDLGVLLGRMPLEAVPAVIGGLLRRGKPEVIGAVVGQIIAYLVERGPGR
jgi:hypothetical protein